MTRTSDEALLSKPLDEHVASICRIDDDGGVLLPAQEDVDEQRRMVARLGRPGMSAGELWSELNTDTARQETGLAKATSYCACDALRYVVWARRRRP